jgi:hypothetical protein
MDCRIENVAVVKRVGAIGHAMEGLKDCQLVSLLLTSCILIFS